MRKNNKITRNRYVFAAVFAALIAVSGFFIIPLPAGVPIVLKNLFVVLSGTVLGSFYGSIATLIFIAAGLIGIPVFVIPGGPGVFLTPLGGYIIGYFLSSLAAGLITGLPKTSEKNVKLFLCIRIGIASFAGFIIILMSGVFYMMYLNSMPLTAALASGFLPFIAGDIIKFAVSIPLALKLRPVAARYINSEE
ncbi:MAG: biotin transporter BioY [Treponema sp.]|nr:biotin transporter BioY [Treponema sp.]